MLFFHFIGGEIVYRVIDSVFVLLLQLVPYMWFLALITLPAGIIGEYKLLSLLFLRM